MVMSIVLPNNIYHNLVLMGQSEITASTLLCHEEQSRLLRRSSEEEQYILQRKIHALPNLKYISTFQKQTTMVVVNLPLSNEFRP